MTGNSGSGVNRNKTNNTKQVPRQNINKSINAGTATNSGAAAKKHRGGVFGKKKTVIKITRYREGVDRIFLILVILMLCMGTVMIFSASYANALHNYGSSYYFARKQLIMATAGAGAMILMCNIDYIIDWIRTKIKGKEPEIKFDYIKFILEKCAVVIFIAVLALNYATGLWGQLTHGAPRWLFGFQPSEFLKFAVVVFYAWYITKTGVKMKKTGRGIILPTLIIGSIVGAMYMQSHISGLIILALICLVMMFIGESPPWFFIAGGALAFSAVRFILNYTDTFVKLLVDFTGKEYAADRILAWMDPFKFPKDEGYQTIQSLYAIGSGGLTGLGLGQSRQKYLFLPEPQNDFIFSVICEEMGFIGAIIIIALFIVLIWRGFVIAYHASDKFSSLVVMGITSKIAIQFLLNIAVVTNTIPNTGISLPFSSYGGTALIVLMAEMGIILSVSRYSYQEKP